VWNNEIVFLMQKLMVHWKLNSTTFSIFMK
jgi:hypothetical protein